MENKNQSKGAAASGSNDTSALPADEQQLESPQDAPAAIMQQTQNPNAEITNEPDDVQEQSSDISPEPTVNLDELHKQTGTGQ